jgi:cytochrome oxidase assembly protein ShyY1
MRRLAFLFRPGWIALALVVAAFTYLAFTVLAPWQLGKNTTTSRENQQIEASLTADPVPVTDFLPQQDSSAPDAQWRRVTATGRYLPGTQVLVRLRVVGAAPAYEALCAFAVDGGPTVLVNRGYIAPEQGTAVPPIPAPPTGTVTITARLRDSETTSAERRQPFTESGFLQVYGIDTSQIAELVKTPLTSSYLQLTEDQPGVLKALPLPQLDAGPFLSYGIQWIAFGILAPIGLGYFLYSEIRIRRREAAARASAESDSAAGIPAQPVTVEEKLADRYGRRR